MAPSYSPDTHEGQHYQGGTHRRVVLVPRLSGAPFGQPKYLHMHNREEHEED